MALLITVIVVALVFEYINGFHDTANSIATVVSTKVLTPRQAVLLAAVTNLLGAMWGTAVAKTISSGLIDTKKVDLTSGIIICALMGAIIWNLATWWLGLRRTASSFSEAVRVHLAGQLEEQDGHFTGRQRVDEARPLVRFDGDHHSAVGRADFLGEVVA